MQKNKKMYVAIVGAILGVILLIFGGRIGKDASSPNGSASGASNEVIQTAAMDAYREDLERRMEKICTRVRGAGDVRVVVSLSGGFEYVYASDSKWSGDSASTQYIVVDGGSDERLVLLYEKTPEITGIGVVCEGGDDAAVCGEITQLLSAAFGVGCHKIHVACGK